MPSLTFSLLLSSVNKINPLLSPQPDVKMQIIIESKNAIIFLNFILIHLTISDKSSHKQE